MSRASDNVRFRFSLAAAFGVVTVCSISLAALRFGDWRWARVMFTVTLALLLAAILGTVNRAGVNRAFWVGFALFGWAYMLCALIFAALGGLAGAYFYCTRGSSEPERRA